MKKKKKKEKDTEYHMADDGTMVEKSDWEWLQEHKKRNKKKRRYNEALPKRSQSAYLYFAQVTTLVTFLFQVDSLIR